MSRRATPSAVVSAAAPAAARSVSAPLAGGGRDRKQGGRPRAPQDKSVRSPAGWGQVKPILAAERRALPSQCFLRAPSSYPICNKRTGNIECRGLLAAKKRAQLVASKRSNSAESRASARSVARKAVAQARKFKCEWAKRGEPQARLDF